MRTFVRVAAHHDGASQRLPTVCAVLFAGKLPSSPKYLASRRAIAIGGN
jgi:hypothetical protein